VRGVDDPLFSVVLPSYNRRPILERVLRAWEAQEPRELPFELVIVDDGSTDGTAELVADWRSSRFGLRREHQPNAGPAAARNRALSLARGALVLFSGDDIEPSPRLLAEHWRGRCEQASEGAAIVGLTRWADGQGVTSTMCHVDGPGAQQFSYYYFVDGTEYDFRHFYTSNVSAPRALLALEPRGFSTEFPHAAFEDTEYAYRLSRHGLRIFYRAAAVAYHHHFYRAQGFFERQVRCGQMARLLVAMHPQLVRWAGLRELEWLRLEMLAADDAWRRRQEMVAADLEGWEMRVVRIAALYDEPPLAETGTLLQPLFNYAFLRGVATSMEDAASGRRVAAELYLRELPRAVQSFARQLAHLGLPAPRADLDAVCGLLG